MREVKVFKWDPQAVIAGRQQKVKALDTVAHLHQFAQDDNGDGQSVPVAVIETADGSVRAVYCEMVQFIEPATSQPVPYSELVAVLREASRYTTNKYISDERSDDEIDGAKWASGEAVEAIVARLDAA